MVRPAMARPSQFPTVMPNPRTLMAGVAGLVAWEVFARGIAPLWIGGPLDASGLIQAALGVESTTIAMILHILTALVAFPAGYVIVVQPLVRMVMPGLPWPLVAIGYGIGLWAFAMVGIAHLLAGFPLFLGFEPVAWASLVGHIALAVAMVGTLTAMQGDRNGHA